MKKGLSNLVTTVLIVLLVLAAVSLIWGFIMPSLKGAGSTISERTECIEITAEPKFCTVDGNQITVIAQPTKETVQGMIATIKFEGGEIETASATGPFEPFVSETLTLTSTTLNPRTAKVAVQILAEDGELITCPPSAKEVTCVNPSSECENDEECDDGRFCNGIEQCIESWGCNSPGNPCSGETPICNEDTDSCEAIPSCEEDLGGFCQTGGCEFGYFEEGKTDCVNQLGEDGWCCNPINPTPCTIAGGTCMQNCEGGTHYPEGDSECNLADPLCCLP